MFNNEELNIPHRGLEKLGPDKEQMKMCKAFSGPLHPDFPTTQQWWPGDEKDKWLEQEHSPNKERWIKLLEERPIEYTVNSYGMRSTPEPFECPNSVMTLGCSFTFGIGMYQDSIWPYLLARRIGRPLFNLGVASGSLDTSFRLLTEWLPKIKSEYVFCVVPPGIRIERRGNDKHTFSTVGAWTLSRLMQDDKQELATFLAKGFLDSQIVRLNYIKNIYAMQAFCEEHGSKFIILDSYQTDYTLDDSIRARDNNHPPAEWHEHITNKFLEKYYEIHRDTETSSS